MRQRKARTITSRVSSVTNGFVQAILPRSLPDAAESRRVLDILGIDPADLRCAYCGDTAHHWDHLYPYVKAKRPSGYLNEARNLVPSCGPCNTSKSGKHWRDWMLGSARGSPTARSVPGTGDRVGRLERLERELGLDPRPLSEFVDPALWEAYWGRRDEIERLLFEAQREAEQIRLQIESGIEAVA
jgi:hypothetical protein